MLELGALAHNSWLGISLLPPGSAACVALCDKSCVQRIDVESDGGLALLCQLEARARQLEGRELGSAAGQTRGKPDFQKYDRDRQGANPALVTVPKVYNTDADITADVRSDVVKEKKKVSRARRRLTERGALDLLQELP